MKNHALVFGAFVVALALVAGALLYVHEPWRAGGSRLPAVEAHPTLADYSWDELSRIAQQVSACADEASALAMAQRYGLCGEDGFLDPNATKAVQLTDGGRVRVQLADVWRDERADGGKAGLTFVFADAAQAHPMNHASENVEGEGADSTGGWAASDMRAWLDSTLIYRLPADLRSCIVPVQKRTACRVNSGDELYEAGRLAGTASDWVEQTTDALWLLSASELCGSVPPSESMGVESSMCAVYGAEGDQYRLFAAAGATAFQANAALVREDAPGGGPCTWWLRTKTLEFGDGFWLVGTDGTPLNGIGEDARATDPDYSPDELWGPDHARGVVAGFCL